MPSARSRLVPVLLAFVLGVTLAGTTAYAAGPLNAKKVKKIAAKVVKKQASSLAVAHARTATSATTAVSATTANTANTARTATTATQAEKLAGYEVVQRVDILLGAASNLNSAVLLCPPGKHAAGGGAILSSFSAALNQSGPNADGTGWDVDVVRLNGSSDVTVVVRVTCLPA